MLQFPVVILTLAFIVPLLDGKSAAIAAAPPPPPPQQASRIDCATLGANESLASDSDRRLLQLLPVRAVDGCDVRVLSSSGDRLWLEPTFCVPDPKLWLVTSGNDSGSAAVVACPRHDPLGGYSYVSLPVVLTNRTLRSSLAVQLAHLKPKSVEYLSLANVSVTVRDPQVKKLQFPPMDFVWSQSDSIGLLRLGCNGVTCAVLARMIRDSRRELLDPLAAVIALDLPGGQQAVPTFTIQRGFAFQWATHAPLWHLQAEAADSSSQQQQPPPCENIAAVPDEVLDVAVGAASCRLRLHRERAVSGVKDPAGGVHAEPLLCYAGGEARVQWDFNRRVSLISVTILLRSEAALSFGRAALTGGQTLTFMRLLDPRPEEGMRGLELKMAADGESMLVQVPCDNQTACDSLSAIESDSIVLFSRLKWRPVFLVQAEGAANAAAAPACRLDVDAPRISVPIETRAATSSPANCSAAFKKLPPSGPRLSCGAVSCQFTRLSDGRSFLVAQQRRSASVRFDRNWTDYVFGFGDEHNFWIGLENMAALTTPNGLVLRIEVKLWDASELHAEYSGFRLTNGTSYALSYDSYLPHRSSAALQSDLLNTSRGVQFVARDRRVPGDYYLQHNNYHGHNRYDWLPRYGNAGWWWPAAAWDSTVGVAFNPNGVFHYGESLPPRDTRQSIVGVNVTIIGGSKACGEGSTEWKSVKEVRLLIEI